MTNVPSKEPMAVLGGGNGGLALAGDLALHGWPVLMYEHPDFVQSFRPIVEGHTVTVRSGPQGEQVRTASLQLATHDLASVVGRAPFLHLIVPVFAQEIFYRALIPLLTPQHRVVVWAARFGALHLVRLCAEERSRYAPCPIVEVSTLPYGCRRQGPAEVSIVSRATQFFAAVHPLEAASSVIPVLQVLFPVLQPVESMLEAAFRNSAMPVLAVGALLNVGAIEARGKDFFLFRDGLTTTVRRVIRALHDEMIAVGSALGFAIPPYPDAVYNGVASIEGAHFRDEAGGTEGFLRLTGPDRIYHRYTIENVRYGLAVIGALGKRHRVPTPTIDTVCAFADMVCGPEFARLGWSLADLGL